MQKNILNLILTRLSALDKLKFVAEDLGQLEPEHLTVTEFPCALFSLDRAEYSDRAKNSQEVDATAIVRIADRPSGSEALDESIYDLMDEVFTALQGASDGTASGLTREKIERLYREDGIREYAHTFRYTFVDETATPVTNRIRVDAHLNII